MEKENGTTILSYGLGAKIITNIICEVHMKYPILSADLGGRVGWLPKADRVKTLFLSPLNAGGGGVGGYPGFVSRFSRHPHLREKP